MTAPPPDSDGFPLPYTVSATGCAIQGMIAWAVRHDSGCTSLEAIEAARRVWDAHRHESPSCEGFLLMIDEAHVSLEVPRGDA